MQEQPNIQNISENRKLNQYLQYHISHYLKLGKQIQELEDKVQEQQELLIQLKIEQGKEKSKQTENDQNHEKNQSESSSKPQKLSKYQKTQQRNKYRGSIYRLKPIAYVANKQLYRFEASRQSFLGPSETNISIIQFTPSFLYDQIKKNNLQTQNNINFRDLDFQKNLQDFELYQEQDKNINSNDKPSQSGLQLEINKYYVIQFVFDRNFTFRNAILPPKARQRVGLYSSRTPHRPNPVGQSIGQLIGKIDESTYIFKGLDLLHKTPIVQIQLYESHFDIPDAPAGWTSNKELINLYYDETKTAQQEKNSQSDSNDSQYQYKITNLDKFNEQLNFIHDIYNCDVNQMVVHKLQTTPQLSRTHKTVIKSKPQVLAMGVFRIEYQLLDQSKIQIINVYPALSKLEIDETYQFDDESNYCKQFLEKFQSQ